MQLVSGTIVDGKVVLEGTPLPDGTVVTVFAQDTERAVQLTPALLAELNEALDDADREPGISAEAMFDKLRKYG